MNNVSYIYQPKFTTRQFIVAVNTQKADVNYIVVCCSEAYNGVYKWEKKGNEQIVYNGKLPCYAVSIDDCTYMKPLQNIVDLNKIEQVRRMQNKWVAGQVRNNNRKYAKKPDWML